MNYFTKYAEQKFDILNKYKVYITREDVENALLKPEKEEKRGSYSFSCKDGVGVIFKLENDIKKVVTFFPT